MNAELLDGVLSGDFRALARLITLVENDSPEAMPYLRVLYRNTGRCFTVGITGAPGSGKSTLVDQLTGFYRRQGKKLGIIAVDPTSPYSGGAILGDRIRMQSRSLDPGTFIRSMATRGHLGGLARTTGDVLLVMDAAGFDIVLIETVGVGQDEVDIVQTAHLTLVLLVPGMGDDIQTMKAGLMEIADVFVVNKADHPGADRVDAEVKALLSMTQRQDGWTPPVVRTIASQGQGIEECGQAIESCREFMQKSKFHRERTIAVQKDRLLDLARTRILQELLRDRAIEERLADLARRTLARDLDPFSAVEELLGASRLRKTAAEE